VNFSELYKPIYECPLCSERLEGKLEPRSGDFTVCHTCFRPLRFASSHSVSGDLLLLECSLEALNEEDAEELRKVIQEMSHG